MTDTPEPLTLTAEELDRQIAYWEARNYDGLPVIVQQIAAQARRAITLEEQRDAARQDAEVARGSIHMACDRLGGRVGGQKTNPSNFIGRIDRLHQMIREQVDLNASQGRETLRVAGQRDDFKRMYGELMDTASRMQERCDEQAARIATLEELLREVEWVDADHIHFCPICGIGSHDAPSKRQHASDCRLAAALSERSEPCTDAGESGSLDV